MGVSPADVIQSAGEYLLSRLLEANSLQYSTFYDGEDVTHDQLCRAIGLVDEDGEPDDWYSAEALIDLAVVQLEEQGILATEQLNSKLADGEPDYLIELIPNGRAKLLAGFKPTYRDME
jgi:hypothetical protein